MAFCKLSLELYAIAWASEVPSLVGLDAITDVGVVATNGDLRSWRHVGLAESVGEQGVECLRRLVEMPTLEKALEPPPTPPETPTAADAHARLGRSSTQVAGGGARRSSHQAAGPSGPSPGRSWRRR